MIDHRLSRQNVKLFLREPLVLHVRWITLGLDLEGVHSEAPASGASGFPAGRDQHREGVH
jgi:hypothetical protein